MGSAKLRETLWLVKVWRNRSQPSAGRNRGGSHLEIRKECFALDREIPSLLTDNWRTRADLYAGESQGCSTRGAPPVSVLGFDMRPDKV